MEARARLPSLTEISVEMTSKIQRRVVILGGGIAGLTAGIAFRRWGWDVRIFERSPHPVALGSGMLLWGSANNRLRELGILLPLLSHSQEIHLIRIQLARGTVLAELSLRRFRERSHYPMLSTTRGELLQSLRDAQQEGPTYGVVAKSIRQQAGASQVSLSNGERLEAEVVVVAEGVGSETLKRMFAPNDVEPTGYTAWFGVGRAPKPLGEPHHARVIVQSGAQITCAPLSHGRFAWYATRAEATTDLTRLDDRPVHERILEINGWPEGVSNLVLATPAEAITERRMRWRRPLEKQLAGRIVLIGDAAHPCLPSLGLGGCLAIEDAVDLARYLTRHHNTDQALRRFSSHRRARVRRWVFYSKLWGDSSNSQSRAFSRLRDMGLRLMPWTVKQHLFQELVS